MRYGKDKSLKDILKDINEEHNFAEKKSRGRRGARNINVESKRRKTNASGKR